MAIKLFNDVRAEVDGGVLKKVIFGHVVGEASPADYKKNFRRDVFGSKLDQLYADLKNGESGTVYLADKDICLRYGGGCANFLRDQQTGNLFFYGPQRNESAPRMPNMVDIAAGLGEDGNLQRLLVREGIEEVLLFGNSKMDVSKQPCTIILSPRFEKSDPYRIYNLDVAAKIEEQSGKLGLFSAYLPIETEVVPLKNQVKIETQSGNFSANVAFEPESIELILAKVTEIPKQWSVGEIVCHDAEFTGDGAYLERRSLMIDAESGDTFVFRNGKMEKKIPLKEYLKEIDLAKTDDKYSTVKVASVVGNWDDMVGSKKGLMPLLTGYSEDMYVLPRIS